MHCVTLDEAQTEFPALIARAAGGETILITADGAPMAKLGPVPKRPAVPARRLGFLAGQFTVPVDFDHMGDAQIAALFGAGA